MQSNGQTLNATGSTRIAGIKLANNGQLSAKPVQLQFAIAQNEQAMTGQVQHATFTVGRATINMDGTYQTSGPATAINLKVNGDGVPIDELVAFPPALGVRLPQGSALKGGTLTAALTVSGSSANPVISGPVRLNNTQLAHQQDDESHYSKATAAEAAARLASPVLNVAAKAILCPTHKVLRV